MEKAIYKEIPDFELMLGIPTGFYDDLLKEDDWSFVIKLSSLFEGACTHALNARIDKPELLEALGHLEMANLRSGKLVMLKQLGAISNEQHNILTQLAALRNQLVHRIANVTFQFRPYLDSLNTSQFNSFVKAFGHGLKDHIKVKGKSQTVTKSEFMRDNAKWSIWATCSEILACLYLDIELSAIQRKTYAARIVTEHYRTFDPELLSKDNFSGLLATHEPKPAGD